MVFNSSCMGMSISSMPNRRFTISLSAWLEMSQSEGWPMMPSREPCSLFLASDAFDRRPIRLEI